MQTFAIGVDLGGTNLRIAAVDDTGKLLEKLTLGTEVKRGRDSVIQDMCAAIEHVQAKYKDVGTLCGIGIGVPGFIDMATGMVMRSPNLADWTNFPVREPSRRARCSVILENDANVAALGEVAWRWTASNTCACYAKHRVGARRPRASVARHDRHGW